jgi:hypothetical protein
MIRIEIDDAVLSLKSAHPEEGSPPYWSGDSTELAKWLPSRYGMFGHYVGDYPAPMDVVHALIVAKKEYQVLEGQEILDLPIAPLPEGVIS